MNQQDISRALKDLRENRQRRVAELARQAQEMKLERALQEARKQRASTTLPVS